MTFHAIVKDDKMGGTQLVIPLRSGEILTIINREIRRALEGKSHCSKRQLDLYAEMLDEAKCREAAVIDEIERQVAAGRAREMRDHVMGRDRSLLLPPGVKE